MTRPIQQLMPDERLDRLVRQLLTERADDIAAAALPADAMAERIANHLRPNPLGRRWMLLAAAALLIAMAAGAIAVGSGLLRLRLPEPIPTIEPRPFAGMMAPTGGMTVARAEPSAVALLDGRVLVMGGINAAGRRIESAEIWDPMTGKFTRTEAPMQPSFPSQLVVLVDGRVLVIGSANVEEPFAGDVAASLFDPTTNTFAAIAPPSSEPTSTGYALAAVRLPDGRVLVTGGFRNVGPEPEPMASVDIFDPATGQFTRMPPLARPTSEHRIAVLPDGRVLLFGAAIGCCEEPRVEIYDAATGRSELKGQWRGNPYCTCSDRMVLLQDGRLLILQEIRPGPSNQIHPQQNLYDTFIWDPVTDTVLEGRPIPRRDDTNVVNIRHLLPLADGRVIVVGSAGYGDAVDVERVAVLDPSSGSLERLASPNGAHKAVVQLSDGRALFIGGIASCTPPDVEGEPTGCTGEPTNAVDLLR